MNFVVNFRKNFRKNLKYIMGFFRRKKPVLNAKLNALQNLQSRYGDYILIPQIEKNIPATKIYYKRIKLTQISPDTLAKVSQAAPRVSHASAKVSHASAKVSIAKTLKKMEVGESVLLPAKNASDALKIAKNFRGSAWRLKYKLKVRVQENQRKEVKGIRIWLIEKKQKTTEYKGNLVSKPVLQPLRFE